MKKLIIVIAFMSICSIIYATNWHQQASFLYNINHYPNLNNNEKALLLAEDMDKAGESFQVVRTYYQIESISVWQDGVRIFPPLRAKTKYDDLDIIDKQTTVYEKEGL